MLHEITNQKYKGENTQIVYMLKIGDGTKIRLTVNIVRILKKWYSVCRYEMVQGWDL